MKKLSLKLMASLLAASSTYASHPAIITEEFISNTPPTESCHASTLTQTKSGTLLCSWFGGTAEGESDVVIWLASLGSTGWSEPKEVASASGVPCWNPVLFTMPSNEVLLFYKAGPSPREWTGFLKRSSSDGKKWSESEMLPAGILGPIKNKPLLLEDGTLLCGSSMESWKCWGCWIDITSDAGKSWTKSTPINVPNHLNGIIQPTLFYGSKGEIKLLARSRGLGAICTSSSFDGGVSWTPARPLDVPNPNAGVDAVNLSEGPVILVFNDSQNKRYPLSVALSNDGGNSFETILVLEDQPGEYSYPCVIQTQDGHVHIAYTWNRKKIKHVELDPALLKTHEELKSFQAASK